MDKIIQEQNLNQQRPVAPQNGAEAPDFQLHPFQSKIFRNSRMLRVWLPPGYHAKENEERHYPIFYLNDGQNLFDPATAFAGVDWHVGQTADALIRGGTIPPLIIVGIDNAQNERIKEYLSYRSFNPTVLRPRGKRYPEFLISEVMPFLYERFRIARGPENTGLGGSSLGGLISLFTVVDRPGGFGRVLIESPSLFVSNRRMLKYSRYFTEWPERVCLGMGTKESGREDKDRQYVQDLLELEQIMRRAGLGEDRLRVCIDEGATHNESAWAKRFPSALGFLFGNR
jgi:predicted alpha/beta superfamily hydrolase